jgi:hypothetical protein
MNEVREVVRDMLDNEGIQTHFRTHGQSVSLSVLRQKTIQQQHSKFPHKIQFNSNKESNDKRKSQRKKRDIIDITIVFVCL